MAPRNGPRPEEDVELTTLSYPPDDLDVDEQEFLAPKTGQDVKRLSRPQVFWNGAREVIQRNNGLLLVVAGEALFAATDAIVKTLQKIDPPVTTLQVRLMMPAASGATILTFATQAHGHSNVNYLHRVYDTHVRSLSQLPAPRVRIL